MMKTFRLLVFATAIFAVRSVITHTPSGSFLGYTSNGIDVYSGIRYGQILARWSPANLPAAPSDTINATAFGSICHQFGPYNQSQMNTESEDCLFLNIWVPARNTSLLPVRMWLHGGGYTAGSADDYDAEELTRLSQSIVVTINYRLGMFGFFPLPDLPMNNIGWLDQQLALRWIQQNIESFGGDKNNVMLFGQSAGGGSVLAHLLMSASWPLYSSVVLESSGPFLLPDCRESEKRNMKLLETYFPECRSNMTCYVELNASRFYQEIKVNWITLWPCVGYGSQMKEQPLALIRKGEFNRNASILGGFNSNEGQSSVLTFNQFQILIPSTRYRPWALEYQLPEELIDLYDPTTTDKNYFDALSWLFGDYYIHCPNLFFFNHLATWSPSIYTYLFVHATEHWGLSRFNFSATHLTELPYVFHNKFAFTQFTPAEANLSVKLIQYFTAFHRHEKPWPSYQMNETVLVFDVGYDEMKTQFGFGKRWIERCPIILKYLDSGDCHAYLSEQECSKMGHCRWIEGRCDAASTSSAQFNRHPYFLFAIIVLYLL